MLFELMGTVQQLYQQRVWEAELSKSRCTSSLLCGLVRVTWLFLPPYSLSRYSRTQLLLWPSFKLSPPSLSSSPVLRDLVFTSHTFPGYSHLSHKIYPLQSSARAVAELTEISSTVVSKEEQEAVKKEKDTVAGVVAGVEDQQEATGKQSAREAIQQVPTSEYTRWTGVPRFLFTSIPKVSSYWAGEKPEKSTLFGAFLTSGKLDMHVPGGFQQGIFVLRRTLESFGGSICTVDPLGSTCTVDPLGSTCTVDPLGSTCIVDPLGSTCTVDPLGSTCTVDPLRSTCPVDPLISEHGVIRILWICKIHNGELHMHKSCAYDNE